MLLLGKIMILQGVGHPISCLGVCYANDPKKGGYTTPAPALDLTTSLRGDFLHCLFQATGEKQEVGRGKIGFHVFSMCLPLFQVFSAAYRWLAPSVYNCDRHFWGICS